MLRELGGVLPCRSKRYLRWACFRAADCMEMPRGAQVSSAMWDSLELSEHVQTLAPVFRLGLCVFRSRARCHTFAQHSADPGRSGEEDEHQRIAGHEYRRADGL